jgi:hypothetical protein
MTPTERETGWPLSQTAAALGSLALLQHLEQQLRSCRQIPLHIRDMGVSQVRGKHWHMALDIDAALMPPGQRGNGQAMAVIPPAELAPQLCYALYRVGLRHPHRAGIAWPQ